MGDTEQPEVWCSKCDQPATATRAYRIEGHRYSRAYCAKHDPEPTPRYIPDAITDLWLRRQFAQATGAVERPS